MDDKISDYISDNTEYGVWSDCCSAEIINGDLCSACYEHCDAVEIEE